MKPVTHVCRAATIIKLILAACVAGFCFAVIGADHGPKLTVLPGFQVTPIYSAPIEQGSWICMTADPKGRLLISSQMPGVPGTNPVPPTLFRLTIANQKVSQLDKIQKGIGEPQGMVYAFDSLYVNGNGPEGLGIYRLRQRGSDDFDDPELLRPINYSGEHGSHALVLGPDKKIYIVSGNYVDHSQVDPYKISSTSPFQHFGEDQLLPSYPDARNIPEGTATSPRGSIARMNASGRDFEIFCGETRNIYDIAFNEDGELFGFDNDHETDWGTPWYRPCLLYHLISGADYGYREGSGKLPDYNEDILPAVKKVSIGAPSGIKFATATKFPEQYRTALFMCDWNFGRIFAAHLHPSGAGYTCDVETVVHGTPLNVTDIEVTPDGAMYFITGGHDTRSTLYRLDYTNQLQTTAAIKPQATELVASRLRAIRHQLETFHGDTDSTAVRVAWPFLSHTDREIRYAARVAIESQPVRIWKERALNETNPVAALTALLALARVGDKEVQPALLESISKFPFTSLSTYEALLKLRALEVSFIRQGRPNAASSARVVAELSPHFPAKSEPLSRELCQILLYLGEPTATRKTLQLAHDATTRESQVYYLYRLSSISNGWTFAEHKDYFKLLRGPSRPPPDAETVRLIKDAGLEYTDGGGFDKYLRLFRKESAKTLSVHDRVLLSDEIFESDTIRAGSAKKRFVKKWSVQDLTPSLSQMSETRNLRNGRIAFESANCILCHRFKGTGGSVGPDLTAIAQRATARDILESIIEPSKVVGDAYRDRTYFLKTGDVFTGKILQKSADTITVQTDPINGRNVTIKNSDIDSEQQSKLSPMPEGLADYLTEAQILDLIAYLLSGTNPKN